MSPSRLPRTLALVAGAALAVVALAPRGEAHDDPPAAPPPAAETTYDVGHPFAVKDVPAGAKRVRVWFWMPEDRPEQKVLDFRITSAPEGARVTRDPGYGRSWVHVDAAAGEPVKI